MLLKDVLDKKDNVFHLEGSSDSAILQAEEALGLRFSDDYKMYLKQYGLLSVGSHEFTGICESTRLNVVESTLRERAENANLSDDMYLLEQIGVENMTIWQNSHGKIFEVKYLQPPKEICGSLLEYIERI